MNVTGISGTTAPLSDPLGPAKKPDQTLKVARQFESLLIGQLLQMSRGEDGGWLGSGDDASSSSAVEMAEQCLAQALSDRGGLGIAEMVAGGLRKG
jgi:Rod binding domain-containing protein